MNVRFIRSVAASSLMSAALFAAGTAEAGFPAGYIKLEYIESTGTQYINTDYTHSAGDSLVADCELWAVTGGYPVPFGTGSATVSESWYMVYNKNNRGKYSCGSGEVQAAQYLWNGRSTLTCTPTGLSGAGLSLTIENTMGNGRYPLYLFAENDRGKVANKCSMRLYSLKITSSDGTPQCDFVPCVNLKGEVGLYDTVRERFFGSADSSKGFVASSDASLPVKVLPPGYERLESVESTGAQFINTEYGHASNDCLVADLEVASADKQTDAKPALFGVHYHYDNNKFEWQWQFRFDKAGMIPVYECGSVGECKGSAFPLEQRLTLTCQGQNASWTYGEGERGSIVIPDGGAIGGTTCPLFLFARDNNRYGNPRVECMSAMRLYSLKITSSDGTPQCDFVPCKASDGTVGLYDLVRDRFFGAAGLIPHYQFPEGYERVDYVSSDGTQYVDADIVPAADDYIDCMIDASRFQTGATAFAFGAKEDAAGMAFAVKSEGVFRPDYSCGGGDRERGGADALLPETTTRVICWGQSARWQRSDSQFGAVWDKASPAPGTLPLYLFARNLGGTADLAGAASLFLYSFKILTVSGDLRCDLVPCRRLADGEIGLYDIVRQRFFASAGPGKLAAPASAPGEIPGEYWESEYIESTGTQYIDTGYTHKAGDRIACEIQVAAGADQVESLPCAFGAGATNDGTAADKWALLFGKAASMNPLYGCGNGAQSTGTYSGDAFPCGERVAVSANGLELGWSYGAGKSGSVVLTGDLTGGSCPLYLFAFDSAGASAVNKGVMRLHSFRVSSSDGACRCDLVPCRHPTSKVIGLYDTVRGRFYSNAGTGAFKHGPYISRSLSIILR